MFRSVALCAATCCALLAACSDSPSPSTGPEQPAPVNAVEITPGEASLSAGSTTRLQVTLRDNAGRALTGRNVTWSSSAPEFAEVDNTGLVTGVGNGVATITASSEGKNGTARITVAATVASVEITTALDTLEAHQVVDLQATLRDAEGRVLTGRGVQWSSSDPAVATVDPATGRLTGVDRGTVTITASSEGRSGTASRVVVIRYRSITTGAMHACDLASGGIAWCWGLNGRDGRIGIDRLGDAELSATPVRVPGNHRFKQLATYGRTTCGITLEGKAYCWGANAWGALGTGSSTPAQSYEPVAVAGALTFQQLAAGSGHICGLATDGRTFCWGYNGFGELGNGLRTSSATPVQAAPGLQFVSLTAGAEYTCGVTATGQGHCWGYDGLGNLGDGRPISFGNTGSLTPVAIVGGHTFAQLSAGQKHTCGVTTAGRAFCWGSNSGKLGNGQGTETSTPSALAGGLTFRSISAGYSHSCAIAADGSIHCWGANGSGQLGVGLANGSNVPVRAAGTLTAAEVSAANVNTGFAAYTCAISQDRLSTYCWGRNDTGQLGNGATSAPTAVNSVPSLVQGQRPL